MKSIKSALLLGFCDWLLPFALSFVIFPLKNSNYYLFESLMTVIVVFAAVLFAYRYFRKVEVNHIREGVLLGILWLAINLVIDFALFLPKSPMQMSLFLYMSQIGIKYLSIPIITIGFGYLKK
jgi:heme/copper-type cytochrome/quinol oxidase subunit 2